jgi:hypothetical protein
VTLRQLRLCLLLFMVILGACAKVQVPLAPVTVRPAPHGDLVPDPEEVRPPHVTLHMDVAFTPEERADAEAAAVVWSHQTNELAKVVLVYDVDFDDLIGLSDLYACGANMVIRRNSEDALVQATDKEHGCSGCILGWMNKGGIHASGHPPVHGAFVVDRHPELRLPVMIHEFGHALGVQHVADDKSMMYPKVREGRPSCLNRSDLIAFCAVNVCDGRTLYPCGE